MLDRSYQSNLKALLASLECHVRLPDEWLATYFEERGPTTATFNDRRRFRRNKVRTKAVLELCETLPAISRDPAFFAVYTRDFSRNSLGFLHTAQLFPMEEIQLWLPNRRRAFRVASCRRFNEHCYLIGAVVADWSATGSNRDSAPVELPVDW